MRQIAGAFAEYESTSGVRTFATQAARKATTVGGSLRDVQGIDQLAREGLRLTQYLVEPGCTPSR